MPMRAGVPTHSPRLTRPAHPARSAPPPPPSLAILRPYTCEIWAVGGRDRAPVRCPSREARTTPWQSGSGHPAFPSCARSRYATHVQTPGTRPPGISYRAGFGGNCGATQNPVQLTPQALTQLPNACTTSPLPNAARSAASHCGARGMRAIPPEAEISLRRRCA